MKTSSRLLLPVSLLSVIFFLILVGCEKENADIDDNGDPVISTTGEATVNSSGGTISVGDETSVIYGASIQIPRNAVDEDVTINIVPGEKENLNGSMVQTVQFLPSGLEFNKSVTIGIPWTSDNQTSSNSKVYYFDPETYLIEEMQTENVDTENKITFAYSKHFSRFFNSRQMFRMESNIMKKGDKFAANLSLSTPLAEIITPQHFNSDYANAREIIENNNGLVDCFINIEFVLMRENDGSELVAYQDFFIKYTQSGINWNIIIYKMDKKWYGNGTLVEVFRKTGLSFDNMLDIWFAGIPIIAQFGEESFQDPYFTYEASDKFEVAMSWSIVKEINISPDLWTYTPGNRTWSNKTFAQLSNYTGDNNNNYIADEYEGNNYAPAVPTNPIPSHNANDVSIATDLQWSCHDPNGDELEYKVYFGTTSNPPLVGTTENITSYTLSGLSENTAYYWYIEATDSDGLSSTSIVWVFTTALSSGSIGCDGVTSVDYAGKTYHTVEIGEQCWFKENLNVGIMINGSNNQSNNSVIEKYCYNDDEQICDLDGALYQWDELMQYTNNEGAQGICPSGWHIPTEAEWKTLEGTVDSQYGVGDPVWDNTNWRGSDAGDNLKSTSGWFLNNNGNDSFGFSVLPAGYRSTSGTFSDRGAGGKFWTSLSSIRMFAFNNDKILMQYEDKSNGFAVRCIKD